MEDLVIYLLKSAGLLCLFFAGYFFLLKNDTNFKTNRIFLLVGILTSFLLPSLEITRVMAVEKIDGPLFFRDLSAFQNPLQVGQANKIDWWQVAGVAYLLGLGFFLLKFLTELFSLLKLIYTHKSLRDGKFRIIEKAGNTQPFSFFRYIVVDSGKHSPFELELILKHEFSHARQWHSVDLLLTNLSVYLLWFNPLAWMYRTCVVQNLEYLADQEVISTEESKVEYQKTLLKISVPNFQPNLTNQFYQSFIKKRIMMLNKKSTQKSGLWKTSLLLPFLVFFIFNFNVKIEAQVIRATDKATGSTANEKTNAADTTSTKETRLTQIDGNGAINELKKIQTQDNIIAVETGKEKSQQFYLQETKPLVFIEGEEQEKDFDVSTIDASTIKSINVLKGKNAVEKYGQRAKDGVIEIDLKSEEELNSSSTTSESTEKAITIKASRSKFDDTNKQKSTTLSIKDGGSASSIPKNVLYVVDGKEMENDFNVETIAPDKIQSINVLKGEKATSLYGEKGSNGVIEINLKK